MESLKERDNDNVNPKIRTNDKETDLESACVKQCDDDRYHPVCCGGETYRNECEAKCAGQSKDTCTDNSCEAGDASARIAFGAADQFQHMVGDNNKGNPIPVLTINAVFIGLIIVAVVAFVVIYAQKAVGRREQKMAPRYDSDL